MVTERVSATIDSRHTDFLKKKGLSLSGELRQHIEQLIADDDDCTAFQMRSDAIDAAVITHIPTSSELMFLLMEHYRDAVRLVDPAHYAELDLTLYRILEDLSGDHYKIRLHFDGIVQDVIGVPE
jgi:hypothetical protein